MRLFFISKVEVYPEAAVQKELHSFWEPGSGGEAERIRATLTQNCNGDEYDGYRSIGTHFASGTRRLSLRNGTGGAASQVSVSVTYVPERQLRTGNGGGWREFLFLEIGDTKTWFLALSAKTCRRSGFAQEARNLVGREEK
jgi:hypothetical protein